MKAPHKHAEVIKAWAEGKEIEVRPEPTWEWKPVEVFFPHLKSPAWYEYYEYRVKPEQKPDFSQIMDVYTNKMYKHYPDGFRERRLMIDNFVLLGTMNLTFDGTTGKLKSAEVL